jgi:hypothetical protein
MEIIFTFMVSIYLHGVACWHHVTQVGTTFMFASMFTYFSIYSLFLDYSAVIYPLRMLDDTLSEKVINGEW